MKIKFFGKKSHSVWLQRRANIIYYTNNNHFLLPFLEHIRSLCKYSQTGREFKKMAKRNVNAIKENFYYENILLKFYR
jgi:hypothetical protein